MANLIYMTKTAWTNLLNSIREKAGYVGTLTASQAKDAVDSIQTGGGDVEILDASYLFYKNARQDEVDKLLTMLGQIKTAQHMFDGFTYQLKTTLDLSGVDMTQLIGNALIYAFSGCYYVTSIVLPPQNKKPTNSVDLSYMYMNCSKITGADLSYFKPSNLIGTFYGCQLLETVNLTGTDTTNTASFNGMFYNCRALKNINLSQMSDTSCYDFSDMFINCKHLTSHDFADWSLNGNQKTMFKGCTSLTEVTYGANTVGIGTKATAYNSAPFNGCTNLKTLRVKATTPPTIPGAFVLQSSNGVCPLEHIYVPAAAVEDYKAATNWSTYADLISADPEE